MTALLVFSLLQCLSGGLGLGMCFCTHEVVPRSDMPSHLLSHDPCAFQVRAVAEALMADVRGTLDALDADQAPTTSTASTVGGAASGELAAATAKALRAGSEGRDGKQSTQGEECPSRKVLEAA